MWVLRIFLFAFQEKLDHLLICCDNLHVCFGHFAQEVNVAASFVGKPETGREQPSEPFRAEPSSRGRFHPIQGVGKIRKFQLAIGM